MYKVRTHGLEVPESELLNPSHECYWVHTTLNVVFSVTCYLELRNATAIYCISQQSSNWLLDIIEYYHLYLVKKIHQW